jgi:hypothetical protein
MINTKLNKKKHEKELKKERDRRYYQRHRIKILAKRKHRYDQGEGFL